MNCVKVLICNFTVSCLHYCILCWTYSANQISQYFWWLGKERIQNYRQFFWTLTLTLYQSFPWVYCWLFVGFHLHCTSVRIRCLEILEKTSKIGTLEILEMHGQKLSTLNSCKNVFVNRGYRSGVPTADRNWRCCHLWEPPLSHPRFLMKI